MFNVPSMKNGGNRLTPQTRNMRASATQEANERQGTVPVTLARVGASYAFLDGHLIVDGIVQPRRAR